LQVFYAGVVQADGVYLTTRHMRWGQLALP